MEHDGDEELENIPRCWIEIKRHYLVIALVEKHHRMTWLL